MYDKFEKREPFALLDTSKYPPEVAGRFNSFITTQFDDSLSVEMQMRSIIKWAIDNFKDMDQSYNDFTEYILNGNINPFIEMLNDLIEYMNYFISEIDNRLAENIGDILNVWLDDGTLAEIINNDVFDMKADKTFVDSEIERLEQKDENLITQLAHITTYVTPDMTLEEIQEIVYSSSRIVFRNGLYKWGIPSGSGGRVLNVPSDTTIEFEMGAKIELLPHDAQHYRIINLEDVENVTLKNVHADGRRDLNSATEGEWGMGISIRGTKNVHLENVETNNCWGDGIYIGTSDNQNYSESTYLTNIKADNNRRQGISVISVKGLYGDNVLLSNTNGTAPEAGIDFEPNFNTEFLEGIRFNNIRTENNVGAGILFYLGGFGIGELVKQIDAEINGHVNKATTVGNSNAFIYEVVPENVHGVIKINQPLWIDSPRGVVQARNFFSPNFIVEINQPTIMNPNTLNMTSDTWDSIFLLRNTGDLEKTLKNLIIREVNVVTDKTPHEIFHVEGMCEGIYFLDPIKTGGLNMIFVGNGAFHVTDKHRVLESYRGASTTVQRSSYSSVIHNEDVTRKVTHTLSANLIVGYPDLTFENRSNTYDMAISIDVESVLAPLTKVKNTTLTLKPGSRITIRKTAPDTWQVLNLIGEYTLYEPT